MVDSMQQKVAKCNTNNTTDFILNFLSEELKS